jgi:hypothetical protein
VKFIGTGFRLRAVASSHVLKMRGSRVSRSYYRLSCGDPHLKP